jgi:hypothetical protein
MSLEAIAALLGQGSMRMTMVYAKIANRTVADEYFTVSEKVEALYNQPKQLPADAEGSKMARLRREMHRRMLGNGYCSRPVGLDCHFESICESCTFFQTTIEFLATLERQRDDAAAKGQFGRQRIFRRLARTAPGERLVTGLIHSPLTPVTHIMAGLRHDHPRRRPGRRSTRREPRPQRMASVARRIQRDRLRPAFHDQRHALRRQLRPCTR